MPTTPTPEPLRVIHINLKHTICVKEEDTRGKAMPDLIFVPNSLMLGALTVTPDNTFQKSLDTASSGSAACLTRGQGLLLSDTLNHRTVGSGNGLAF